MSLLAKPSPGGLGSSISYVGSQPPVRSHPIEGRDSEPLYNEGKGLETEVRFQDMIRWIEASDQDDLGTTANERTMRNALRTLLRDISQTHDMESREIQLERVYNWFLDRRRHLSNESLGDEYQAVSPGHGRKFGLGKRGQGGAGGFHRGLKLHDVREIDRAGESKRRAERRQMLENRSKQNQPVDTSFDFSGHYVESNEHGVLLFAERRECVTGGGDLIPATPRDFKPAPPTPTKNPPATPGSIEELSFLDRASTTTGRISRLKRRDLTASKFHTDSVKAMLEKRKEAEAERERKRKQELERKKKEEEDDVIGGEGEGEGGDAGEREGEEGKEKDAEKEKEKEKEKEEKKKEDGQKKENGDEKDKEKVTAKKEVTIVEDNNGEAEIDTEVEVRQALEPLEDSNRPDTTTGKFLKRTLGQELKRVDEQLEALRLKFDKSAAQDAHSQRVVQDLLRKNQSQLDRVAYKNAKVRTWSATPMPPTPRDAENESISWEEQEQENVTKRRGTTRMAPSVWRALSRNTTRRESVISLSGSESGEDDDEDDFEIHIPSTTHFDEDSESEGEDEGEGEEGGEEEGEGGLVDIGSDSEFDDEVANVNKTLAEGGEGTDADADTEEEVETEEEMGLRKQAEYEAQLLRFGLKSPHPNTLAVMHMNMNMRRHVSADSDLDGNSDTSSDKNNSEGEGEDDNAEYARERQRQRARNLNLNLRPMSRVAMRQMNTALEISGAVERAGVSISSDTLQRALMIPQDRPLGECLKNLPSSNNKITPLEARLPPKTPTLTLGSNSMNKSRSKSSRPGTAGTPRARHVNVTIQPTSPRGPLDIL